MITEDYVSFEVAKLLKEKGFKHWCYKSYGDAVYYKGEPISFDEECELISEGLENEIEYVEGGCLYDFGCDNRKEETKVWAAPTLQMAMKWLREVHKIEIRVIYDNERLSWYGACNPMNELSQILLGFGRKSKSYEEACEESIRYCLQKLI